MSIQIEAVSLLLERFGTNPEYNVYLDVYDGSFEGTPRSEAPLATAVKISGEINNKNWYNFVFSEPITIHTDYVLFTLRQDQNVSTNDFIVWVHSDIDSSDIYPYGYAVDTTVFSYDSDFVGYYSVYNYTGGSTSFFDVFGVAKRNDYKRCIKIYREFNNYRQKADGVELEIPGYEVKTQVLDNRQDFISAFNSNTDVLGDRLTLSGIGRRIGFVDKAESNKQIYKSNIGLPSSILSFDMSDGDDEYNCIGFAGSELDGLYKTINSGASWSKVSSFPGNNITSIRFSPVSGTPKTIIVAALDSSSEIYVSTDSGTTWNDGVSITNGDKVIDMAWQDANTVFISTLSQGVLKYTVNSETLSSFNSGITTIPEGRKLFIDFDQSRRNTYYYGYGYGSGDGSFATPSFFDVFNVSGSLIGYGLPDFQAAFAGTKGFGYGYEYYSFRKLYWATDSGLYVNDLSNDWYRVGESSSITNCHSVYANDNLIYVGLEDGLSISYDNGLVFYKNDFGDIIKIKGINSNRVNQIRFDSEESLFTVAQNGSLSQGPGVLFQQIINDKEYDDNILDMVINPVNTNIIHVLTNSTLGQNDYITFLVDNSSSLRFSDPNNKRKYIVESISDSIYSSNNNSRFQIIQFEGTNPQDKTTKDETEFGAIGTATNITEGFTINNSSDILQTSINKIGISQSGLLHLTTPLLDSLYISMKSIIAGGLNFSYDQSTLEYDVALKRDDNASIAEHVLVIVTDGKDTDSLRTISEFVNNQQIKNQVQIRTHIIIIGNNYNREVIYNIYEFFNKANLYFASIDSDTVDVANAIATREAKNINEGIFRKVFKTDEYFSEVEKLIFDSRVPSSTKVKVRYRYSDNNDTLIDESWTNQTGIPDGDYELDIPNVQCKFFEIEIYMKKETSDEFPLINSITLQYKVPRKSTIVLNSNTYSTNRIEQLVFTRNIFLNENDLNTFITNYGISCYGYGLGIGHIDARNKRMRKLGENWFMAPSNAWQSNTSDALHPEKPSYTLRRNLEKCTTTDNYNYYAINGGWQKDIDVSVYIGSSIQSESTYDLVPENGLVRFHKEKSPSENIYISMENGTKRRLFVDIKNSFKRSFITMRNTGIEYLPETETETERTGIATFASQSIYDSAVVLNETEIPDQSNATITGLFIPEKTNIIANQSLTQVSTNTYVPVTFGDLFIHLDDDLNDSGTFEILPHQDNWIFGDIGVSGENKNIITMSSSSANSLLELNTVTDEDFANQQYAAFRVLSVPLSLDKSLNFTIGDVDNAAFGFDFTINQESETEHLETKTLGAFSSYVWVGNAASLSSMQNSLDYSNEPMKTSLSVSNLELKIDNDLIANNANININLQILNSNGEKYKDFIGLVRIDVQHFPFADDTTSYTAFEPVDLLIDEGDNSEINYSIKVNPGVSYVIGNILGTDVSFLGPPIKHTGSQSTENLYFGDLNTRSAISTGRQSPDFIYQYARDISRLDFCAVADNYDSITNEQYLQIDRKARLYNSNNQFICFSGFRFVPYNFSTTQSNKGIRTIILRDNLQDITNMSGTTKPSIEDYNNLNNKLGSSEYLSILQLTSYDFNKDIVGPKYNYNFASVPSDIDSAFLAKDNVIEIYSEHGSIENESSAIGLVDNQSDGSNNHYFQGCMNRGNKLPVMANSNSDISRPGLYNGELSRQSLFPPNNNRGITGCWTTTLSKESIFAAFQNGRIFASTGIKAYFDCEVRIGALKFPMGSKTGSYARDSLNSVDILIETYPMTDATINVYRYGNFDDIESSPILVGSTRVFQDAPNTYTITDSFTDTDITALPDTLIYFVKLVQDDKHCIWGSPVYVALT